MKKAAFVIFGLAIAFVTALTVYNSWHSSRAGVSPEPPQNESTGSGPESAPAPGASSFTAGGNSGQLTTGASERKPLQPRPGPRLATRLPSTLDIHPAFESLLEPQSSFQRKEQIWAELTGSGKLDVAIGALEQGARDNPGSPEIPAALGRAYLQKAGIIDDVREQGILGMKADQTFEAALMLDSKNWDARFWKATAMSHWPVQLNKTPEVVEDLVTLVQQQEALPQRPEFVQTYVLLGEQYEKVGDRDDARQSWERGLTMFPDHASLKGKLAKQP